MASNSPDVKAMAYCWLFHLVGDIHQPLHCTALFSAEHFPKGDRGGFESVGQGLIMGAQEFVLKRKPRHPIWLTVVDGDLR